MQRRLDLLPVYAVACLAFLYAPVVLLPVFSFNDSIYAVFPLKGFTIKAYEQLISDAFMLAALKNSAIVAAAIAVVSTAFGLLAAIALTRFRIPGRGAVLGLTMLPLVIPSIILAISILIIIRKLFDLPLTLWTVGAGHVLICLPFSILVLMSRLEGFDKSLEEAASDLGETPWMVFWRVTFPLVLPGIVSSLLMAFTISFDEYVIAFFLSGTEQTLPIFLYSQLRYPEGLPKALALGSVILFASTILIVISEILRRRGVQSDKSALA